MPAADANSRWGPRYQELHPYPLPQQLTRSPLDFISELFSGWSAANGQPASPQPKRPTSLKLWIPGSTLQPPHALPLLSPSSYARPISRDRRPALRRHASSSSRTRVSRRTSTSVSGLSSPIATTPHADPALVAGLSSLPPELWHRVLRFATYVPRLQPPSSSPENTDVEFVPPHSEPLHLRRTKRNLVQVCSLFRTLATPFLYEYLVPENSKQTAALLKLFTEHPDFGGHVRRIAFAVIGYAHDVRAHLGLVREVLQRTPGAVAVHVLYLSGNGARSGLPEVLTTAGNGDLGWKWRSLEWTDASANEARVMERLLSQCPLLEQLTLTGDVVAPAPVPVQTHRRSSSAPLPSRGTDLVFHSLCRLILRDTHPATLALVASWRLPALTHLTLILTSTVSYGAAHALIARYAHGLKFLRFEAPHLPRERITSLIALCADNAQAVIVPLGTLLPRMEKLQTLGWVRGTITQRTDDLEMLDQRRMPSLDKLVAVESARFALSRREMMQFNARFGRDLVWQDYNGDEVARRAQ